MRSPLLIGPLVGLAVLLAACGGGTAAAPGTNAPAPTTAPATEAPATEAATPPASSAAAETAVNLVDTSLGKVLVDGKGMTLYMFTADSAGTATCYEACAQSWPPILGTATPGTGLDAEDFATTTRTDGTTQATFYGMPLYLFAGDAAPGDVNGQGVGGKWYVLGADGKPIK